MLSSYLAVVQLLNDFFVFFANVTHTDEFCFSVTFKKLLTNSLYNCYSWTASGYWAVFNIPEDSNGREVFQDLACYCNFWRPCTGLTQVTLIPKYEKKHIIYTLKKVIVSVNIMPLLYLQREQTLE